MQCRKDLDYDHNDLREPTCESEKHAYLSDRNEDGPAEPVELRVS
jgi:hypothetical protein